NGSRSGKSSHPRIKDRAAAALGSRAAAVPFCKWEYLRMKRLMAIAVMLVVVGLIRSGQAAEDPTGTWKWTVTFNNNTFDATLKLKLEGDKLTGSMPGRDNQETPISDASYKDGKLSFSVTREINGQKRTTKYEGTVSG